jgi:redox-sensitive bicupin YhaK (pirin superfamily)
MHRDSLGTALAIRPGELNWMTAGRGIVHSERTPPELRTVSPKLFGIQSWVALSARDEEVTPDFIHYGSGEMPVLGGEGKTVRIIAGSILGGTSPVRTSSSMFYADVMLAANASIPLDPEYEERAIYTVTGDVEISGEVFGLAQLLVFRPGDRITIRARTEARFMMLGGDAMDGPRFIWWNFVSSRKDRIEQAKADWKAARFDTVPGDEVEFIPCRNRNRQFALRSLPERSGPRLQSAIYESTLAPVPPLVPTGTATALARVERRAIELNPETLRVIRVGEAEKDIVYVGTTNRKVPRGERERVTEGQHFAEPHRDDIRAHGDPVRPLAGEPRTRYFAHQGKIPSALKICDASMRSARSASGSCFARFESTFN